MRVQTLVLALLASAWFTTCPTYAARDGGSKGKERTAPYVKDIKATNKAKGYLKKMPTKLRDALIAVFYHFHFMEDGSSLYIEGGDLTHDANMHKTLRDEVKFVATDGNVYPLNATLRDVSPAEEEELSFIFETKDKCGANAVFASYSKEIKVMKQYFTQRSKGGENIQEGDSQGDEQQEDVQEKRNEKEQARDFKNVAKKIQQKIVGEARTALVACLVEEVPIQNALEHSYANSKGELCFVYEQLLHEDCLEAVLEVLDTTSKSSEIGQKVLSKFEKKGAALEKGKKMRELLLKATQKQYESYEAEIRTEDSTDRGVNDEESVLHATIDMISHVEDPLCQASLILIGTKGLTIEQIFSETVQDAQFEPHSCYDALNKGNALNQAFSLMTSISEDKDLVEGLASHYASQCTKLKKAKEKRNRIIQLALKQYEARATQKKIQDLKE